MKLLMFSILFISVLVVKLNNGAVINSEVYVTDEDLTMKWNEFKIENTLIIESDEEEKKLFELFRSDYIHVKNHNLGYLKNETSFSTCVNQFSVMSQDEYLSKYTIKTSDIVSLKMPADMPAPLMQLDSVKIPDSFDWRSLNMVSKPENQKKCGGCWAFASASAVETLHAIKDGKLVGLSKQELIDCTIENLACDGGWPVNGFYHAYVYGLIEDEHYPYVSRANNCTIVLDELKRYKIKGYANIPKGNEEEMKRVIATYGPVTVAIDASDWSFSHYSNGIFVSDRCRKDLSNHALLVVGYGREDNQDYWIVKNSWGVQWGEKGYIRMARNRNNMCGIASVAVYAFL